MIVNDWTAPSFEKHVFRSGVISDVGNFNPEHVKQNGMPGKPPQACLAF